MAAHSNGQDMYFAAVVTIFFLMAALCNRAGHYISALWFLSSFFYLFFHRLISAAADWMSTILPRMVWP